MEQELVTFEEVRKALRACAEVVVISRLGDHTIYFKIAKAELARVLRGNHGDLMTWRADTVTPCRTATLHNGTLLIG